MKERGPSDAASGFGHAIKYLTTVAKGHAEMHLQKGSFFNAFAQLLRSSLDSRLSIQMHGKTYVLPATGPVPFLSFFVFARIATIRRGNFASADFISKSSDFAKSTSFIFKQ